MFSLLGLSQIRLNPLIKRHCNQFLFAVHIAVYYTTFQFSTTCRSSIVSSACKCTLVILEGGKKWLLLPVVAILLLTPSLIRRKANTQLSVKWWNTNSDQWIGPGKIVEIIVWFLKCLLIYDQCKTYNLLTVRPIVKNLKSTDGRVWHVVLSCKSLWEC